MKSGTATRRRLLSGGGTVNCMTGLQENFLVSSRQQEANYVAGIDGDMAGIAVTEPANKKTIAA